MNEGGRTFKRGPDAPPGTGSGLVEQELLSGDQSIPVAVDPLEGSDVTVPLPDVQQTVTVAVPFQEAGLQARRSEHPAQLAAGQQAIPVEVQAFEAGQAVRPFSARDEAVAIE